MFRIKKILNINVVLAEEDGQEYIVFGKGVGYHQKINNLLPNSSVVKKFIPVNDSRKIEMIQSLNKIPPIYIDITTKIVEYAEKVLRESLLSSVYYSLTDHLYFAVQRYNSHQALGNRIYWEMKTYYPEMFDIGEYGLNVIKETLKISLPKEEAANIAFHIINASTKSSDKVNILDVTQIWNRH
ncbi:PRD domain-containing protein [Bombilactobacillus bombi]|uniref:PRD domain-containing protein n=1 Tax=Bombilactobacillus bombi TaxID=1303590 RepID=UPI00217544C6|nr:PRD domain-containing protein [Bombilactobacillus bombi]